MMGWSRSFVGTLFMAFITTLPEIAVTLLALRLRALDMAMGNQLGSSLFNVAILAIDDIFYTWGPLLADASPVHGGTAIAAVVMSGLVMIGLMIRPQGRELRVLSWVSVRLPPGPFGEFASLLLVCAFTGALFVRLRQPVLMPTSWSSSRSGRQALAWWRRMTRSTCWRASASRCCCSWSGSSST